MKNVDRFILGLVTLWLLLTLIICGYVDHRFRREGKDYAANQVDLKTYFDSYNDEYFLGVLPRDTVVEYGALSNIMGITSRPDGRFHITIDADTNRASRGALMTLLHECCHESQWNLHEDDVHGPKFQSCMHRLADAGAFDNLW